MSGISSDSISSSWHIRLRRILVDYFSNDELETLCFDLRVNYDDLEADNQTQKAVALINHLARLGRIEQLIDLCSEARPNVPWSDLRQAALQNPLVVDERPDQAAGVATPPVQRLPVPSQRAGISPSPFVWAALALLLLASIGLLVWVVGAASRPLAEAAPGAQATAGETAETTGVQAPIDPVTVEPQVMAAEATETATQPAVPPAGMLVFEDFENGAVPQWRDIASPPDLPVALPVISLPGDNHVLRLKDDVQAFYNPSWDWDTADYRLEAYVMVIEVTDDTSVGLNVRVASPSAAGYCQGYRAEIGLEYAAIHRITVPNNNCDDSVWQYDALNYGSFELSIREWHHLRLDVTGNQLRFFIDGVLTLVATDPANTYPGGGVGLMVFNSDAVYVDDIVAIDLSSNP